MEQSSLYQQIQIPFGGPAFLDPLSWKREKDPHWSIPRINPASSKVFLSHITISLQINGSN